MAHTMLLAVVAALAVLAGAAATLATGSPPDTVFATAWCANSLRLEIPGPGGKQPPFLPASALVPDHCSPPAASTLPAGQSATHGSLTIARTSASSLTVSDSRGQLFSMEVAFGDVKAKGSNDDSNNDDSTSPVTVTVTSKHPGEHYYGMGQTNWTRAGGALGGCSQNSTVTPFVRNGQHFELLQRKFHVAIPFIYSDAGYGFLFNMPGYGNVSLGEVGRGGMSWRADAAHGLDLWITVLPADVAAAAGGVPSPFPIYAQFADAAGHVPALREDAMRFWQSRLRYKSSAIALAVADKYRSLGLAPGVLVVDFYNQVEDGDFKPNPACYPSLQTLADGVRNSINASVVFSFWPEMQRKSSNFDLFNNSGCLINSDLGGLAYDPTLEHCRSLIQTRFLKPNYVEQGVTGYWLDETDGEGTAGGDGNHGYDTSYGPAEVATNLWVNEWIRTFAESLPAGEAPLILTRGVWAGGARHGVVLWSSDIEATFEELTAQVQLGVHASLSGVPWWTSDVGGFGCGGNEHPSNTSYMQELVVRWYQFGAFSPVFRTHGCRNMPDPDPDVAPCVNVHRSCGGNEIWSYGEPTQKILTKYVTLRASMTDYIAELSHNASVLGRPTVTPLAFEFPDDASLHNINDQYMLGTRYMVAPVTQQHARSRSVRFPAGARWQSLWNAKDVTEGGVTKTVDAPLDTIPVFVRV